MGIPLGTKAVQTITNKGISEIFVSIRKSSLMETTDGEVYTNKLFPDFLNGKNFERYSRFILKKQSLLKILTNPIADLLRENSFWEKQRNLCG